MSEYKQALVDLTKSLSNKDKFPESSFLTMAKLLSEKSGISLFSPEIPTNSFDKASVVEILLKQITDLNFYFSYDFSAIKSLEDFEKRSFKVEVEKMKKFIGSFQYSIDSSYYVEKITSPLLLDSNFYLSLPSSFWEREDQIGLKSLKAKLISGLIKNKSERAKVCLKQLLDSQEFSLIVYSSENPKFISKSSPLFSIETPEDLLFLVENGIDLFQLYLDGEKPKKLYEFFVERPYLKEVVFNYLKEEDSTSFDEISQKKYFDRFSRVGKHNIGNIMEAFKDHESYWTLTNDVGANSLMMGLFNAHSSFLSKVDAITNKKSDQMFQQLNNFGCSAFHYFWNFENTLDLASLKILSKRCPKLTEDGSGLVVSSMKRLNIKEKNSSDKKEKPFPKIDEKVLETSLEKKYLTPSQIWSGSKEDLDQLALYLLSFSEMFIEKNKWEKNVIGFNKLLDIVPNEVLKKSPLFAGSIAFMRTHFSKSLDDSIFNQKLSFDFATEEFFENNKHFSIIENKDLEKLLAHNVILNSFNKKESPKSPNRF